VSSLNLTGLGVVGWFFRVLLIAAFVVEVWAFVDGIRQQTAAFPAAGKLTKPLWLIILGVALVIGITGALGYLGITSFLPIVAFVASAVYLADVRPKVREMRGNSSHQGPYGPW
jgi:Protein of unknown function (DUF2516)